MVVRQPAEWMSQADERLLEFLEDAGPLSPTRIAAADRIRLSRSYLNVRLRTLAAAGLAENLGNGVYRITDSGRAYLDGRYDATDLPRP